MNKLILVAIVIVGLGIAYLTLDYMLVYAQPFPIAPPSNSTNLFPLSNQSKQSLVGSSGSLESLMQSVIDEAEKPGLIDTMIDECRVLETGRSIEEGKEFLECQERILNESK
ncbi:MAG: hypothetical protein WA941_09475 [Nitrososphaeraceae archaeon]